MSKQKFKKLIQTKHAQLKKWANERGIRFKTSKEIERDNDKNRSGLW